MDDVKRYDDNLNFNDSEYNIDQAGDTDIVVNEQPKKDVNLNELLKEKNYLSNQTKKTFKYVDSKKTMKINIK